MKKYNNNIMKAVRQRLGLEENDESLDERIMKMNRREVFREYCLWNGLLGSWYDDLLTSVENIYDVKLDEGVISKERI